MTVGRLRVRWRAASAVRPAVEHAPPPARVDPLTEALRPERPSPMPPADARSRRPRTVGKFLRFGDETLVRGVTYGTFRPDEQGDQFPAPEAVARDFALMAADGINAVRTYTPPPGWLLDLAARFGLHVMVGIAWEQHVAFLADRRRARSIEDRVRAAVRAAAGHPAVLCYVVGNEIPAPIVRWHGRRRIERFLERLCNAVREEDPGALVTYVNYPPTEYLQLPFVDFLCFNVYLEEPERLDAYLARLHNLAGDRPLVLAEIGLDSRRNGAEAQARSLDWQVRTAFAGGCAGVFVFAWTDEWHVRYLGADGTGQDGADIEDWDFGLVTRDREAKPALATVSAALAEAPFSDDLAWPGISVVVCSYNGARTLGACLRGLLALDYAAYEVIVVDDGSTDATAAIAREYGVRVISTENRGLSSARNTGMQEARGEIVAYIDDDCIPDPRWLRYLAAAFMGSDHAGIGGPNIPPDDDGPVAGCVANAPGGPIHVLLDDRQAEHIPGCNAAFRKDRLEAVGGFDPRFRAAGDDVDLCWRMLDAGWTLGFSPAAVVWHRRRSSVRAYWRQQVGYGRAEAMLEAKWPERYSPSGHVSWGGRLYGSGLLYAIGWRRWRVYHGRWGSGLFQSLHERPPSVAAQLPQTPEWYLVLAALAALGCLGALWTPLLAAFALLALAAAPVAMQAVRGARAARFAQPPRSRVEGLRLRCLTGMLYVAQPAARLWGRISRGLSPWRRRSAGARVLPLPRTATVWSERWRACEDRLRDIERTLHRAGVSVRAGGAYDRWELEVGGGVSGSVRLRAGVEEHGAGRQLLRYRLWPVFSRLWVGATALSAGLAAAAFLACAPVAGAVLAAVAVVLAARTVDEASAAMAAALDAAAACGRDDT